MSQRQDGLGVQGSKYLLFFRHSVKLRTHENMYVLVFAQRYPFCNPPSRSHALALNWV
jgi:hypothetical protein